MLTPMPAAWAMTDRQSASVIVQWVPSGPEPGLTEGISDATAGGRTFAGGGACR
jgi:hypothetical protein